MTVRPAAERERGKSGVEMAETRGVMLLPRGGIVMLNGEGVYSVKGMEVVEVRKLESFWSEYARIPDVDPSGVFEEAAFFSGKNALVVSSGQE